MRIAVSTLFVVFCLICTVFFVGRRVSVMATPSLLYVDAGNVLGPWNGTLAYPYQNITSAVENSVDGDTIFVHDGTYVENVVVDKSISLVGESVDLTFIDGSSKNAPVISIIGAVNASVMGFTVVNSNPPSYSAILLQGSSGTVISYNKVRNNQDGISLSFSSGNVITHNILSSNFYNGIDFYSSSDNLVSDNVISDNSLSGVNLDRSSEANIVTDNTLSLNYYGVYISSSSENTFFGNTFSSNNYGFFLTSQSVNNTIYHNNMGNIVQASCSADSVNAWSYRYEGNFWTDYSGHDLDNDGIGDVPYPIPTNNQDDFPLMGKFSTFDVTFQGETYDVAIISNSTFSELALEFGAETGNKILRFTPSGQEGTFGFCRIAIPISLMPSPYVVLIDSAEVNKTVLEVPDETHAYLYFAYPHENHTVSIISSLALHLYYELFDDFLSLNRTYFDLLNSYNVLAGNYTQLLEAFGALNASYVQLLALNATYGDLLNNYLGLNSSYNSLLNLYGNLVGNFSQLQDRVLNSEQAQDTRNLAFIVAGLTAIYIVTTVYLSKRAHTGATRRAKMFEEEK